MEVYVDFVIRFYVHSKAIRTDYFPHITQSRINIISRECIVYSLKSVSNWTYIWKKKVFCWKKPVHSDSQMLHKAIRLQPDIESSWHFCVQYALDSQWIDCGRQSWNPDLVVLRPLDDQIIMALVWVSLIGDLVLLWVLAVWSWTTLFVLDFKD